MLGHYTGTVECEALTMVDMVNQHVLPSLLAADLLEDHAAVEKAAAAVAAGAHALHSAPVPAVAARVLRLETMVAARKVIDAAEVKCPEGLWTLATYKELLFLDSHDNGWQ